MHSLLATSAHRAALEFLLGRIDFERTSAIPYGQRDFRLERMHELLGGLGNPEQGLPIIHIAGTKGKGSTGAMIAAMLTAVGYRTGLYSSPHLDRVEERMAIDGRIASPEELVHLVNRVAPAVAAMDARGERSGDPTCRPTYFEIITAMALVHFAEQAVDAAVLEVGLGGRLDSTNVCTPLVSVITSISFDHTKQLGNTLAAIAGEKAGIIKPGVPVVSGVMAPEAQAVVAQVAAEHGCRLVQRGVDFDASEYSPPVQLEQADRVGCFDFATRDDGAMQSLRRVNLRLLGAHQAANAAVALATMAELRRLGWQLPEAALRQALAELRWPARVELVGRRPAIVLDGAHNVASIEALVQVLGESFQASRRLLIFATTQDKDVRGMLAQLLPRFDEVILTRYQNNPRGVGVDELAALSTELGYPAVTVCPDPAAAWQEAQPRLTPEHLLVVTGSFFIAAELRAAMNRGQS